MEVTLDWEDPALREKLVIICKVIFVKLNVKETEKAFLRKALKGSVTNTRFSYGTQDILKILRGCLISHRFLQALRVLEHMSLHISRCAHGIYTKNSLFTMENVRHEGTRDSTEFFVRHVSILSEVNKKELVLEYLNFRLRKSNFEYPADAVHKLLYSGLSLRKSKIIDPLLEAYITLFSYIAWSKAHHLCAINPGFGSQYREEAQSIGEKIISEWSSVINKPGVWDIFLEKLIQVLLSKNYNEQCNRILKTYVETNPDYLNAYVYTELYSQNVDSIERQQNLKKIADMSPSDELVLDYVDILVEEQNVSSAVKQIFLFMDYSVNKECLRGWTTLVEVVYSILLNQERKSHLILKNLWKQRYQYWPLFHFDTENEDFKNEDQTEIRLLKCIFLCMILKSKDHVFVQITCQNMEVFYPKILRRLKKKLRMVDRLNKLQL